MTRLRPSRLTLFLGALLFLAALLGPAVSQAAPEPGAGLDAGPGAGSDARPAADPSAAFRRAVDELEIQTAPGGPPPPPKPPLVRWRIPSVVVYALGCLLLLALLHPLLSWLVERLRRRILAEPAPAAPDDQLDLPGAGALEEIRQSAEQLAAAGRFGEAVHALLLRTIELLKTTRGLVLPPSLTSREIALNLTLPPAPGESLRVLIDKVEPAWFGLKGASEDDWLQCRAAHELLSGALTTRVPDR